MSEPTIEQRYQSDILSYDSRNPDFFGPEGAYFGFLKRRVEALAEQGYDDDKIKSILSAEERALAEHAYDEGRNPAEIIHEKAKGLGWKSPDVIVRQYSKIDQNGERRMVTKNFVKGEVGFVLQNATIERDGHQ